MDRDTGLQVLRSVLDDGMATRQSIAKRLGMHPSQVSRIAAGKFIRMDGHALKVCKLALLLHHKKLSCKRMEPIEADLNVKVAQIVSINPSAANALSAMLGALIDQWSSEVGIKH